MGEFTTILKGTGSFSAFVFLKFITIEHLKRIAFAIGDSYYKFYKFQTMTYWYFQLKRRMPHIMDSKYSILCGCLLCFPCVFVPLVIGLCACVVAAMFIPAVMAFMIALGPASLLLK